MSRPTIRWLALVFALLFSGSSYQNTQFLLNTGIQKQNPYLIWQAFVLGETDASAALFNLELSSTGKEFWYDVLAKSGNVDAAKYLAENSTHKHVQTRYYKIAAEQGDANAQFEYALLQDTNLLDMNRFLALSAKQNYAPAVIAYAKFLHTQIDADEHEVIYWLDKAAHLDAESAIKLAKRFWLTHNKAESIKYFKLAKNMGNSRASSYINVLQNYAEQKINVLFESSVIAESTSCLQTIQPVALSLESMVQAVSMYTKFYGDKRMESLDMCLLPPRWLPKSEMECQFDINTGRNTCDLIKLASYKKSLPFSHMAFFVERGKAYVQHGVMYIDLADEYSVFVHELAHFVGFVDEYKLSHSTARVYCSPGGVPNLLFYDPSDPKAQKKLEWWDELFDRTLENADVFRSIASKETVLAKISDNDVLGQSISQEPEGVTQEVTTFEDTRLINADTESFPSLSISPSRACDNINVRAFKPTAEITFLEHHDTENIPEFYIEMWQALLKQKSDDQPLIRALFNAANQSKNADLIDHWADAYYSL